MFAGRKMGGTSRLWRDVKCKHVFLHEYENGRELHKGLKNYFQFRNKERPHEAIGYKTPWEVYTQCSFLRTLAHTTNYNRFVAGKGTTLTPSASNKAEIF